jgi:hypothetical protein
MSGGEAVGGVRGHPPERDAVRDRAADHGPAHGDLGGETDLIADARPAAPFRVVGPGGRQRQPAVDRCAATGRDISKIDDGPGERQEGQEVGGTLPVGRVLGQARVRTCTT